MVTWEDVLKLKPGATLYEEQYQGKLIIFVPLTVVEVRKKGLLMGAGAARFLIPRNKFPIEDLYLEG